MTLTLDDWHKAKKKIEEITRKADKIEAEYKLAMEEIREKDKVKTLKRAKLLHAKKTTLEVELFKEWIAIYKNFKRKYKRRLEL